MKKNNKPNLPEQSRPLKREIQGIIFLLFVVVLGISLISFHPGDYVFWINTGQDAGTQNLFGQVGAHLAGYIFRLIGFSSFWLIVVLLVMAFFSFSGKKLLPPVSTCLALFFLLVSFSGILCLSFPDLFSFRGGEVRSGGIAGYYTAKIMLDLLNHFGAYVLLSTIFIISLMISTRFSLGLIFSGLFLRIKLFYKKIREYLTKRREKKRKKRIRIETVRQEKARPRRKVTIVQPKKEPPKKPKQETFSFMQAAGQFKLPSLDLLNEPPVPTNQAVEKDSLEMNARRLEKKLLDFGVQGEVVEILPGPVITMYEFRPAPGIKISKVTGLADDLTLALRAPSVRIIAPLPNKAAIGIEIANNKREPVYLSEALQSDAFIDSTFKLPMALGKDITGMPYITDLAKMPHLLVAGATGTGKSVSLNAMINSILFKISPDNVRFIMIDPKRIELSIYKDIPHLLHPVVTQPKEATRVLRWAVEEMERRYMLLSDLGVRNIEAYNRKILKMKPNKQDGETEPEKPKTLPYIILIIDELADLMMVSSRDVEEAITRLAQMARAAGIHLIIATQRPSVDVLTGIIKANFPTRISFQVSSKVDSRTILDTIGAEHLLGEGDMLFLPPGVGRLNRIHGAYISEEEVKRVTDFLRNQAKPEYDAEIMEKVSRDEESLEENFEKDEKYEQALEVVLQTRQASISMLQRKLRVGYNRAARMIEIMEYEGIVGPSDGVKPREVYGRKLE